MPGDVPSAGGAPPPPGGSGSSGSGSGSGSGVSVSGRLGAPIDLWDTNWPESGYYWTVVPVSASALGAATSTVAAPGASVGSALVPVADSSSFAKGLTVTIGTPPSSDTGTIVSISGNSITLSAPLKFGHAEGEAIVANGSSVVYQDLELPEDVCAAGRVQRFGIESEPSLTTAQAPFATGLSATGRLTSAANTSSFYGQPLVAWTPALGADIYQVQGLPHVLHLVRAPAPAGQVVVPGSRLRLQPPDRGSADELVGPAEARGVDTEVQGRHDAAEEAQVQGHSVVIVGVWTPTFATHSSSQTPPTR